MPPSGRSTLASEKMTRALASVSCLLSQDLLGSSDFGTPMFSETEFYFSMLLCWIPASCEGLVPSLLSFGFMAQYAHKEDFHPFGCFWVVSAPWDVCRPWYLERVRLWSKPAWEQASLGAVHGTFALGCFPLGKVFILPLHKFPWLIVFFVP